MSRSFTKKISAIVGLSLMCATAAEATPAFARQMDTDCMSCHFQNMPKLNSFGREFKMSGYTMTGTKDLKSEASGGLSLPVNLNMGFVTKARVLSNDYVVEPDGKEGSVLTEIFDEAAFIFGGKISDNVGISGEFADGLLGGKVAFTAEAAGGRVGAVYHMTDALGAFAATEIYSSGLYRPIRQFENRKKTNIFQALGIGDGEATGAQLYYGGNGLHVTAGLYVPVFGASARADTDGFKTIARAAYEFNVADTTVAIGGYHIGGKVARKLIDYNTDGTEIIHKVDSINYDALDRTSYGIDLQVESAISGMPLMVTGGYVLSNKYNGIDIDPTSPEGTPATYTPTAQDKTGFHLDAQINPFDTFGVKAAILGVNDDKTANRDYMVYSAGLEYSFTQNVRFCFEYSYTSSDRPDTVATVVPGTITQNYSGNDFLLMAMVAF